MQWSHNQKWLLSGDQRGLLKYWQPSFANVKNVTAHNEPIRAIRFSPTDAKFVTCSDDATIKVWDFVRYTAEHTLVGHGSDVKSIDWHPRTSLLVSGSRDSFVKLWDARTGEQITTLDAHMNAVAQVAFNPPGDLFASAGRDLHGGADSSEHWIQNSGVAWPPGCVPACLLIRIWDTRTFRVLSVLPSRRETTVLAWHPLYDNLLAEATMSGSGQGTGGSIHYWIVGSVCGDVRHSVIKRDDQPQDSVNPAHDRPIWGLAWHPIVSEDTTAKFWARPHPGDGPHDRYYLPPRWARDRPGTQQQAGGMGGAGERGALDDRGGTIARERESALRGVGLPPAPPLGPMAGVVPAGRRTTAPLAPDDLPAPVSPATSSAMLQPSSRTASPLRTRLSPAPPSPAAAAPSTGSRAPGRPAAETGVRKHSLERDTGPPPSDEELQDDDAAAKRTRRGDTE